MVHDDGHPRDQSGREERERLLTRRHLLQQGAYGIGALALTALLNERLFAEEPAAEPASPMAPRPPHFAARARSVIFLFMAGAPSQLDLFDPKPLLQRHDGQPIPDEIVKGERFAFIKGTPRLLGSPHAFRRAGESGRELSELLPHLAGVADDLCFLRSVHTDQFNHAPAQIFMNSGTQLFGRPSMGSWVTYGLGSASQDLPGFVVLLSGDRNPDGGKSCWSSGFLPTVYQGVEFRSSGDPVLFVSDPEGVDRASRKETIDTICALNLAHLGEVGDPEIATRIAAYELAYRMQASVPGLMDIAAEPAATHALYGTSPGKPSFANNCLLARRLVERGVRFVQLYHRGWDHHGTSAGDDLVSALPRLCRETDRAAAALVSDLKRRGLLETTLVVWGGEFGRTPMNEGRDGSRFLGRDHHPRAFTVWMAGGGTKAGALVGETDDIGYTVVKDPVHVHDLHATILHLLGIDHTRLTYGFQGRQFRLTDVAGSLVTGAIA